MQKNKIDVVRAVCNSAVKKLAVLSLAVSVSSGAVASANPPKRNIPGLPSTTQGKETLQERLRRLERERDEKEEQLRENDRWIREKFQQGDNKLQIACSMVGADDRANDADALCKEADTLYDNAKALLDKQEDLFSRIKELAIQIAALRAQIGREQQGEPVEEMIENVPENDEMKEEAEEQRENQNATTEANIPKDAFQNMLRLHMPNQRKGARGGMFSMMMPFGGKK